MRRPMSSCLLLLAACGAQLSGGTADPGGPPGRLDAGASDAVLDALQLGPWSTPAPVGVAATIASDEDDVTLSSDALELIFAIAGTAGAGKELYYTSRAAIGAAWSKPAPLPFNTPAASEEAPRFSGDDLTLYFASDRVTAGDLDVYGVTRSAPGSNTTWDMPRPIAAVRTTASEKWFAPCANGRYVVVRSVAGNGTDLLEGTLTGGDPAPIVALDTTSNETGAFLTQDCTTIYFTSDRVKPRRIFVSHRAAIGMPWQPPTQVDDFKLPAGVQEDPWLSPDGRTFALASNAAGTSDIYLSTR
ncbi:MAG TPA: hypothetical protein VK607_00245 [Kofleriaceae bacterium]|nr:hypothetical protein [Kofleriaceae bacterium]